MGIFDPRLPHLVDRSEDFGGTRYCIIFFKMWDWKPFLAPFYSFPHYLEENVFLSSFEKESSSEKTKLEEDFSSLFIFPNIPWEVRAEGLKLYFSAKNPSQE